MSDVPARIDARIECAILRTLAQRDGAASICPSEIARALATRGETWRALMPQVRQVTRRLLREQRVAATRGTQQLAAEQLEGGPIRIRRGQRFDDR